MRPKWTYLTIQYNFSSISIDNNWNKKNNIFIIANDFNGLNNVFRQIVCNFLSVSVSFVRFYGLVQLKTVPVGLVMNL